MTLGGFGIAYLGGRLEEGLAHIERALTLNPNSLVAWRFGGTAYWMIGKHEKSIQYYERAMQLSPRDPGDSKHTWVFRFRTFSSVDTTMLPLG